MGHSPEKFTEGEKAWVKENLKAESVLRSLSCMQPILNSSQSFFWVFWELQHLEQVELVTKQINIIGLFYQGSNEIWLYGQPLATTWIHQPSISQLSIGQPNNKTSIRQLSIGQLCRLVNQ